MYNTKDVKRALAQGGFAEKLGAIYGKPAQDCGPEAARFISVIEGFEENFPGNTTQQIGLYSAPGRTEIGGNHTDHQLGCVLAGSVNIDIVAAAAPNGLDIIRFYSQGYGLCEVDLNKLLPQENETGTTAALIRGVAAKLAGSQCPVMGFDAYCVSDVLGGSGLSSSAAFETLIGNIVNDLDVDGRLSAVDIAKIGQYTENVYFGKPCGLMDQMASSVGGIVSIDFADTQNPIIQKVNYDFAASGHVLCIIDTHSDHADLTHEYAAIPEEMKQIAGFFGKSVLREVDVQEFETCIPVLRESYGDRAVLRAHHFFKDNARALAEAEALKNDRFDEFLRLVNESGRSSYMYLQDTAQTGEKKNQAVNIALAFCEEFLGGTGAVRVHGGGFAGTIQAFVPVEKLESFKARTDSLLGEGSCQVLTIRPAGGVVL